MKSFWIKYSIFLICLLLIMPFAAMGFAKLLDIASRLFGMQ